VEKIERKLCRFFVLWCCVVFYSYLIKLSVNDNNNKRKKHYLLKPTLLFRLALKLDESKVLETMCTMRGVLYRFQYFTPPSFSANEKSKASWCAITPSFLSFTFLLKLAKIFDAGNVVERVDFSKCFPLKMYSAG